MNQKITARMARYIREADFFDKLGMTPKMPMKIPKHPVVSKKFGRSKTGKEKLVPLWYRTTFSSSERKYYENKHFRKFVLSRVNKEYLKQRSNHYWANNLPGCLSSMDVYSLGREYDNNRREMFGIPEKQIDHYDDIVRKKKKRDKKDYFNFGGVRFEKLE